MDVTRRLAARMSLLALAVMMAGLALAACGSSGPSGSTTPGTGGAAATKGTTTNPTVPAGSTTTTTTPTVGAQQTPTAGQTPSSTQTPGVQSNASGNSAYKLAPAPMGGGASQPGADPNATLTLNLGNEVTTVDPQVEAYVNEIAISSKVFAPLLTLNDKNQVAANVATSMQVSKDGRTYTFKLRKTSYTNGQPVTANDYAFAIKRACDPQVNGEYSNIVFDIVGCQDWRTADPTKTPKARMAQLKAKVDDSVKALDDYTLQVKLVEPAGYFPYVMATWITYPTPRASVEKAGNNWWKQVDLYYGNGPFKLVSHTNKQQWVLERNDDYFRGKPGIKTLVYKEVTSSQTALLAYKQGEFDMIELDPTLLPQVERDPTLKSQLHRQIGANTYSINFNLNVRPFDNVKVRQAFSYAMDREQYIKQIDNNAAQPAGTFLYPGIAGYQTKYQQKYDPQLARKLLAEAGFPNGRGFPTFPYYYDNTDQGAKQRAIFWSQMFKKVLNVNIVPTPMDPAELQNLASNNSPKLKIQAGGWIQDYPHPQDWLSLVYGNGSSLAPIGWNDPHFNVLVNKADKLPIQQATPLYQQADAYLAKMAPSAFYMHAEVLDLVKPNVKGYVRYPTDPFDMIYQPEKVYKTKG